MIIQCSTLYNSIGSQAFLPCSEIQVIKPKYRGMIDKTNCVPLIAMFPQLRPSIMLNLMDI